jgi:hypothetical protein
MNGPVLSLFGSILIGLGATLILDLWSLFLRYVFGITPSNFCLVGRWILYMPEGIFRHSNIGSAPQKRGECTVGWIAHYIIGITFAIGFATFTGSNWLQFPRLIPALIFGLISVSIPFFIMQPALGLGFAASKTSNPLQARVRTLTNHLVFGIGLYLFASLANLLLL